MVSTEGEKERMYLKGFVDHIKKSFFMIYPSLANFEMIRTLTEESLAVSKEFMALQAKVEKRREENLCHKLEQIFRPSAADGLEDMIKRDSFCEVFGPNFKKKVDILDQIELTAARIHFPHSFLGYYSTPQDEKPLPRDSNLEVLEEQFNILTKTRTDLKARLDLLEFNQPADLMIDHDSDVVYAALEYYKKLINEDKTFEKENEEALKDRLALLTDINQWEKLKFRLHDLIRKHDLLMKSDKLKTINFGLKIYQFSKGKQ